MIPTTERGMKRLSLFACQLLICTLGPWTCFTLETRQSEQCFSQFALGRLVQVPFWPLMRLDLVAPDCLKSYGVLQGTGNSWRRGLPQRINTSAHMRAPPYKA